MGRIVVVAVAASLFGSAALAELDRKRDAHGSSADNDDLMPFAHALI